MVKSRYIGDGHPTFNRNPYNGCINPYYWVDDHPLFCGNNGSLDPGTYSMRDHEGGMFLPWNSLALPILQTQLTSWIIRACSCRPGFSPPKFAPQQKSGHLNLVQNSFYWRFSKNCFTIFWWNLYTSFSWC